MAERSLISSQKINNVGHCSPPFTLGAILSKILEELKSDLLKLKKEKLILRGKVIW